MRSRRSRFARLTVKLALFALIAATAVRYFVVQPFVVSGPSMEPTYRSGDYVVIDKLAFDFQKPKRGEVIVFHYPLDPSQDFIKRIVGLPGETVNAETGAVVAAATSTPQDQALSRPDYGAEADATSSQTITLANDEYYVLGDNRAESTDSRTWGPLESKFIIGVVIAKLWPL